MLNNVPLYVLQYDSVVEDCTAALELDPRYVKALLRRQQANERLEKYDLAAEGEFSHPMPVAGVGVALVVSSQAYGFGVENKKYLGTDAAIEFGR